MAIINTNKSKSIQQLGFIGQSDCIYIVSNQRLYLQAYQLESVVSSSQNICLEIDFKKLLLKSIPLFAITSKCGNMLYWLHPYGIGYVSLSGFSKPKIVRCDDWILNPLQYGVSSDGAFLYACRDKIYRWRTSNYKPSHICPPFSGDNQSVIVSQSMLMAASLVKHKCKPDAYSVYIYTLPDWNLVTSHIIGNSSLDLFYRSAFDFSDNVFITSDEKSTHCLSVKHTGIKHYTIPCTMSSSVCYVNNTSALIACDSDVYHVDLPKINIIKHFNCGAGKIVSLAKSFNYTMAAGSNSGCIYIWQMDRS